MGAFYTPDLPYDLNTWLDNLGAYSVSDASFATLDTARKIIESGQYYFMGVPFPGMGDFIIPARETFTGDITVPPLSYVICLTGDSIYNEVGPQAQPVGTRALEGFQFRIYDKGGKIDTFFPTSFGSNVPSVGLMQNYLNPSSASSNPAGPFFPPDAMVVHSPGALQLTVTNLAPVECVIQILLQLAVPVTRLSANEMLMKGNVIK